MTMGQCPSNFRESGSGFTCVRNCPTERGFENRDVNGQPRCVYKDDATISVNLTPISWVYRKNAHEPIQNLTVERVKDLDPGLHSKYVAEEARVSDEIQIIYSKIERDTKLRDAFQKLQDAENVRDQTPSAYQQARTTYYTLLKGDTWKEEERKRVLKAEVSPLVQSLVESKNGVMRQYDTQRRTIDVVKGLKDKVLSIKDDVKYAADTFRDQLDKVKNAIHRDRRERDVPPEPDFFSWFDMILNIAIVVGLLYVIYTLYRKFTKPKPILPVPRLGYA
jgi:hypothetical protein